MVSTSFIIQKAISNPFNFFDSYEIMIQMLNCCHYRLIPAFFVNLAIYVSTRQVSLDETSFLSKVKGENKWQLRISSNN